MEKTPERSKMRSKREDTKQKEEKKRDEELVGGKRNVRSGKGGKLEKKEMSGKGGEITRGKHGSFVGFINLSSFVTRTFVPGERGGVFPL